MKTSKKSAVFLTDALKKNFIFSIGNHRLYRVQRVTFFCNANIFSASDR